MGTTHQSNPIETGHRRGRTLLELRTCEDGTWIATQHDVDVEGTGDTGALAAMEYCRKIAAGHHE